MYSIEDKLYNEIDQYFNEDGSIKITATEDIHDVFETIKNITKNVASLIKRYVPIAINNIKKITFRITKKYDYLLDMWNSNINKNIRNINEEKYSSMKVKVVNLRELLVRIEFLKDISSTLTDIRRIVNDSSSEWKTMEIDKLIKSSMRVGFDSSTYQVTKKLNKVYLEKRKVENIIDAGYTVSKVVEVVSRIDPLVKVSRFSFLNKTQKHIDDLSNEILAKNKILSSNTELTNNQKRVAREELETRTIRLWWISQFVTSYYVLLDDVLTDIVTVCSAVEKCIDEEN